MVIIGFDPGSITFGVGIVRKENGSISCVHSEEIKLRDKTFHSKMMNLWERLRELYSQYPIEGAAIEEGFLGKNIKSMNVLSQVRGVVLASLLDKNIKLEYYSPREIKLALTGNGSALKEQVKKMVSRLLNIQVSSFGEDESDALAVAYCHSLKVK